MAMPARFWQLGTFHRYYSGAAKAPYLTIIIGGNHETSNYMWELYHGGWLAPRIYYLGAAGSILLDGLRISGASGIYKSHDYRRGHFERLPFDHSSLRSIYHIREFDVFRLAQLALDGRPPSIFLSHDWPLSIERYGDTPSLLRAKPFFAAEVARNELGSPPLAHLLSALKPEYWFSAHLHVRFAALWKHDGEPTRVRGQVLGSTQQPAAPAAPVANGDEIKLILDDEPAPTHAVTSANVDEIELSIDDATDASAAKLEEKAHVAAVEAIEQPDAAVDESVDLAEVRAGHVVDPDEVMIAHVDPVAAPPADASVSSGQVTKFLALDKCLPGRHFLQIIDVAAPSRAASTAEPRMTFDPLWLAITRAFHGSLPLTRDPARDMPFDDPSRAHALITRELEWVRTNVAERGECSIDSVQLFAPTAPAQPANQKARKLSASDQPPPYTNPQTEAFCAMLQIPNKINPRSSS